MLGQVYAAQTRIMPPQLGATEDHEFLSAVSEQSALQENFRDQQHLIQSLEIIASSGHGNSLDSFLGRFKVKAQSPQLSRDTLTGRRG